MAIPGGSYLPTTQVWDVSEIYSTDVTKPEFKELLVRMYQQLNNMALSLNGRDAGTYHTDEFVNGQTFFPNPTPHSSGTTASTQRQVHRKVIDFGALPNTTFKKHAHGIPIQGGWTFTRIYGCASDPVNLLFIPLPYSASVLVDNIKLKVDATDVTVTTAAAWPAACTSTYIVLEYLKQ